MIRIVLTGGSGDLGMALSHTFVPRGDDVVNLDLRPAPYSAGETFVRGSILKPDDLKPAFKSADMVIHIAGLHGIHLAQGKAVDTDFQAVNVDGTRNVFAAAHAAGINKVIHVSTSDVHDKTPDVYGQSKIDAERIARDSAAAYGMKVIILRPRAFIPPWNEQAYTNPATRFADWAQWFLKGSVHLRDVAQATMKTAACLMNGAFANGAVIRPGSCEAFDVDGTYLCTQDDIALLKEIGFTKEPVHLPEEWRAQTESFLGYMPAYGLRDFIVEWKRCGAKGPGNPYIVGKTTEQQRENKC
ncbi:MAG: NAD(P)-dependent oxidoreductase [Proteobacteria bacterium]|nr:NAD(P)-dependent oxidoreductase [Pseudomonadota bacterium]